MIGFSGEFWPLSLPLQDLRIIPPEYVQRISDLDDPIETLRAQQEDLVRESILQGSASHCSASTHSHENSRGLVFKARAGQVNISAQTISVVQHRMLGFA